MGVRDRKRLNIIGLEASNSWSCTSILSVVRHVVLITQRDNFISAFYSSVHPGGPSYLSQDN